MFYLEVFLVCFSGDHRLDMSGFGISDFLECLSSLESRYCVNESNHKELRYYFFR